MPGLLWLVLLPVSSAAPSVEATATSGARSLDLDGEGSAGPHVVKVADVTITTASANGCTVTVSSGGIRTVGGSPIPYQITTVADGDATPTAAAFSVSSGNDYTFATASASTVHRDVYVRYTPGTFQNPGLYTETVSFSVANNPL